MPHFYSPVLRVPLYRWNDKEDPNRTWNLGEGSSQFYRYHCIGGMIKKTQIEPGTLGKVQVRLSNVNIQIVL